MSQLPFHKKCKPFIETCIADLDMTSAWLCKVDIVAETVQVVGFGVAETASSMEKVSDLFEKYDLNTTPKLKSWLLNQAKDPLIFQIRSMPANDPDRREYFINGVHTVIFTPLYSKDDLWGFLEIWETRRLHEFSPNDLVVIENTVHNIISLLAES